MRGISLDQLMARFDGVRLAGEAALDDPDALRVHVEQLRALAAELRAHVGAMPPVGATPVRVLVRG